MADQPERRKHELITLFCCMSSTASAQQEILIDYRVRASSSKTLADEAQRRLVTRVKERAETPLPTTWSYAATFYVGGFTHHDTGKKPNKNHEQNPEIGMRFTWNYEVGCLRPYMTGHHVFVNSRHGTTDLYGAGLDCTIGKLYDVTLHIALMKAWGRATDKTGHFVAQGNGPVPTFELEYRDFVLSLSYLGSKLQTYRVGYIQRF